MTQWLLHWMFLEMQHGYEHILVSLKAQLVEPFQEVLIFFFVLFIVFYGKTDT